MSTPVLLLFAKLPVPGHCKTRLGATIGPVAAARLADCFLLDSVERFSRLGDLWLMGDRPDARSFERWLSPGVAYRYQGEGSLGERLARAFRAAFDVGRGALALGADTPHLPREIVAEAGGRVGSGEVVVGPSPDGGYYLIGWPGPVEGWERCFAHDRWGGPDVLACTEGILEECGIPWCALPPFADIDEWSDLLQWTRRTEAAPAADPPLRSESAAAEVVRAAFREGGWDR
ncbi:MAG: TIGR04282 family arsenosugar biosynthesis glycosyltransferase [Planctomycetes bacterium]|nr:TIGR04282 family arsenosugar biosynthesis glycosyltransferase [Planctomycetota bacterium]